MSEERWDHTGQAYHFDARAQRLLAQDVQAQLDRLDRLFGMYRGRGCYDNCLESISQLFMKHLIVVTVYPDAFEIACSPFVLSGLGGRGCNDLGPGGHGLKMEGMSTAHSAQARDGNFELWRRGRRRRRHGLEGMALDPGRRLDRWRRVKEGGYWREEGGTRCACQRERREREGQDLFCVPAL